MGDDGLRLVSFNCRLADGVTMQVRAGTRHCAARLGASKPSALEPPGIMAVFRGRIGVDEREMQAAHDRNRCCLQWLNCAPSEIKYS